MRTCALCEITFSVDAAATRLLYDGLPPLNGAAAPANFLRNVHMRRASLERFFGPLGIDPEKCRELAVLEVDPFRQSVWYGGFYPFVGQILSGRLPGPEDGGPESMQAMDFGFELCVAELEGRLCLMANAMLPWLYEPPIEIPRYINQAALPAVFYQHGRKTPDRAAQWAAF